MDHAQRYAGYSMEDLRDVERHINRAKYPGTYAALMAEIERREGERPGQPPQRDVFWVRLARRQCKSLMLAVCLGCIARAALGNWLPAHALPRPDAEHTQRLEVGGNFFVYVTPEQAALSQFLELFLMPGLPAVLVLAVVVGLRSPELQEEPEEDAPRS